MKLIKREVFDRTIKDQEDYSFDIIDKGLYWVSISAKCKNWLQNYKKLFNDDDLAIEIDGFPFFEFKGKRKEFSSPASFNGNELKNLTKTNFFLIPFSAGKHILKFFSDQTPFLEDIKIFELESENDRTLKIFGDFLPKSENNKLFFDIAIKNIVLNNVKILAKADVGDKFGLKINGKTAENSHSKKYKIWYWLGTQLKGQNKELSEEIESDSDLNYLEFKGEGNPIIENIEFNFIEFDLNKSAKVALYKDIELSDFVNLRSEPDDKAEVIIPVKNGEKVKILEEFVIGSYVENLSYVWHKIKYKEHKGFVLSSFIEIEGQERDRIIEIIKNKAKEIGIDENLVLALAGCESRFKVYASSGKAVNSRKALGVFQITEKLKIDLNNPSKPFYSPIDDLFNFEENITAGIKYFAHLYNGKYKNSSDKLSRAVAAYNTGPADVPVKGKLNLDIYDKETCRLVNCVIKNYKRKNWLDIFWPTLLIILAALNFAFFGLNYSDGDLSPNLERSLTANINNLNSDNTLGIDKNSILENKKKIIWKKETDELLFLNDNASIVYRLPAKDLKIDEILKTPAEDIDINRSIFVKELAEEKNKIFYFSASESGYCGSGGCSQIIYRFNLENKELRVVKNRIFGHSEKMIFSPDGAKAALSYCANAGAYCGGCNIEIINLESFESDKIQKIESKEFPDNHLKYLSWKNNNEIEFSIDYWNCGKLDGKIRERIFDYNLQTGQIFMKREAIRLNNG